MDQMDSMGGLPARREFSEPSTHVPALNAKALGADFEALSDVDRITKMLFRLIAALGEPFGQDDETMAQMAKEWCEALGDLPAIAVDGAISRWIRTEEKWPKPAQIRKLAEATVSQRVDQVSTSTGMHPRRLDPSEEMKAFKFTRSGLRTNPAWAKLLDSIHPTHEHCFFAKARMGEFAHVLHGLTSFEYDNIREKWGDKIRATFGRSLFCPEHDRRAELPEREDYRLSAEEIAKRAANCLRWREEAGFDR